MNECRWQSVYGSLVMQTRLQPYLDAADLVIDETEIRFDAAGLAALVEARRGGMSGVGGTILGFGGSGITLP